MLTYTALTLDLYDEEGGDVDIDRFITKAQKTYPKLVAEWGRMSFVWAINSADTAIATKSFELFQKLLNQTRFSQTVLEKLVLSFYVAVKEKEDAKVTELLHIFRQYVKTNQSWDEKIWKTLFCCGYTLLSFSTTDTFSLGLELLNDVRFLWLGGCCC